MQVVYADQVQVVFHTGVDVNQDDALGCSHARMRSLNAGMIAATARVPQTVGALWHGRQCDLDVQRLGTQSSAGG
jgi:hypothetical protein